ncbi:MAG: LysR family transcriptional regulator [Acidobacteriaceae bacterium]|nr:LysR family transcriptional regulator [Acidobacteriaceae bacterium]
MIPTDFSSLTAFVAVAEEKSFTRAAKRQGVSPSAISHTMRGLEETLGVRLIARTTRSVALTEAGEQLLDRLRPALNEVGESLRVVAGSRAKPAGRVRLLVPRFASSVIAPKLGELFRRYPDIILDITTDDSRRDIVRDHFDAGIHFGEYIQKDMIAVRVSPDHRPAIVGHRSTFGLAPNRNCRVIFSSIAASTFVMALRGFIAGNSRRDVSPCRLRSTGLWLSKTKSWFFVPR